MADKTEISWTDATFNPWWGCTAVSPGCDNCYAEAWDARWGGNHWGKDTQPRVMSDGNWKKPHQWNKKRPGIRVFCASMCDVFDKNAPTGQRERLWNTIRATPNLHWQLLTKRAPNIEKYLPEDWGNGYNNAWLGVTVENRKHGLPRINTLRKIPSSVRFLSIEPLLEDLGDIDLTSIDWVIVGGESGKNARVMQQEWALNVFTRCREQGVPFFFKQQGGTSSNKGGSDFFGRGEVKEWPILQPDRVGLLHHNGRRGVHAGSGKAGG